MSIDEEWQHMVNRLKRVAPNWARVLGAYKYIPVRLPEREGVDIRTYNKCIVGECWNWKSDYYAHCEQCERYARRLFNHASFCSLEELTLDERRTMLDIIMAFLDHFEKVHK